jgi:hypothetical protein
LVYHVLVVTAWREFSYSTIPTHTGVPGQFRSKSQGHGNSFVKHAARIESEAIGAGQPSVYTGDACLAWPMLLDRQQAKRGPRKERVMNNVFYIIGVVVVVLAVLGYFGFR